MLARESRFSITSLVELTEIIPMAFPKLLRLVFFRFRWKPIPKFSRIFWLGTLDSRMRFRPLLMPSEISIFVILFMGYISR